MCRTASISLKRRVEKALSDFVSGGEMFTLVDISNAIKADGEGFVRHRECRGIARDLMADEEIVGSEDYVITPITVSTSRGPQTANLYHPDDCDPDDYVERQTRALGPNDVNGNQPSNPIFTHSSDLVDDDEDDDDDIDLSGLSSSNPNKSPIFRKNDMASRARAFKLPKPRECDGAVEIPLEVLKESGINGEYVVIENHPNSVSVTKNPNGQRQAYSGMRISRSCLAKSNMDGCTKLEAAAFNGKIVIGRS